MGIILKLSVFIILIIGISIFVLSITGQIRKSPSVLSTKILSPKPSPSLPPPALSVQPADAYTIIMVGDSMTQLLGENSYALRNHLKEHYPKKVFGIFNYGIGSTSILSVLDRLNKPTISIYSKDYPPILKREFDLILIESFGYNPLSQFPIQEGLKKQSEELDKIVWQIHSTHPKSVIAFVATIAPNRDHYGEGAVDLSTEKRREWADERTVYIKNHMLYARRHGIFLIDVYDKSLISNKLNNPDANLEYIENSTHIHPSPQDLDLISKTISDFISDNKILPP